MNYKKKTSYFITEIKIDTPQFKGNSYLVIDEKIYRSNEKQVLYTSKMRYKRNVNNIYMNFTTAKSDGLLLWGEMVCIKFKISNFFMY